MSSPNQSMPRPPYYAVIFTSRRTLGDDAGYAEMGLMSRLVSLVLW